MLPNQVGFKRVLLIVTALFLSQYAMVAESHFRGNQPLAAPYTMQASAYLALAENQTGTEQQSLRILAAGRMIYDGQWQNGLNLLVHINPVLPELQREKSILLAKIDLIQQHPKLAIVKLSSIHQLEQMSLYYQVQYHEMLATAYRGTGNILDAVNERIKLGKILPNDPSLSNNRRALWLILTTIPSEELNSLAVEDSDNSELEGWIQLAVIARTNPDNVQKTLSQLQQWKIHYPHHPGNAILPSPLEKMEPYLYSSPKKIGLLLPMTGKLAGPGTAIYDGFMDAYYSSKKSKHIRVQLYDTDKASASTLYQQAIADGVDYVVGPLGKTDVAAVAAMDHSVPTVLLNDIESRVKPNAYQFGLSPMNEARQVAFRARKNGHLRTLIIAPANSWGDEVLAAFTNQWTSSGGQVVDVMRYSETQNIAPAVKNILHAVETPRPSAHHSLSDISKVKAESRRRQDFDMIFLLAYPSKARQIMPMLRYYFAGDVPVYATSAVYTGHADPQKDRDLNGILFCDMPWVFNHQMRHKNWPEQWNSYNRLYALGMDSFFLVTQLNQLLLFPAMGVSDHSGVLYLNANQRIVRILAWGKFRQGLAEQVTEG